MTKRIYIYSPSGAVRDRAAFKRGVDRLRTLGHEVELDPSVTATHMRFAGDDATRLAAVERAARSAADVAMTSRGGYGLTRLLPDLPYRSLARAIDGGMKFVGLSDFTALQMGVLARSGSVTWAGPSLLDDFGGEAEPDEIMQACLEDLLCGQGEGTGWRLPRQEMRAQPLELRGTLWGGNLSMVSALVGTPWLPEVKSGLLFLEDVNEHPYRIERMLTQLLHAGILGRQKAILLGQFTAYRPAPHDKGFNLAKVIAWLREKVKAPVFTGLPFGHVPTKVCLPVGARVQLVAEGQDAFLLWGHRH